MNPSRNLYFVLCSLALRLNNSHVYNMVDTFKETLFLTCASEPINICHCEIHKWWAYGLSIASIWILRGIYILFSDHWLWGSTTLIHNHHGPLKWCVAIRRTAIWKFAHNPDEFLDTQAQNPMEMNKRTLIVPNLLIRIWIVSNNVQDWYGCEFCIASLTNRSRIEYLLDPICLSNTLE